MDGGLDKNVDSAMEKLNMATRKANQLRRQAGFMWMYGFSLLLFAVFLLILFIGLQSTPPKCPSNTPSPVPAPVPAPTHMPITP